MKLNLTYVTYVTILQLLKATWLHINKHTVMTNPTHALFVHTKPNSQPVLIIIWRNMLVILLYALNVTIRQLWRVILRDIWWHTQVNGPLRVHIVPTGLGKRATLPDTQRFVNMPQSQQYELYFRQQILFNLGVQLSNQHYILAWQFAQLIACPSISPRIMLNCPVYLKDLIYCFKLSSLCNDPSTCTALQVATRTLSFHSLVWTSFLKNVKAWYIVLGPPVLKLFPLKTYLGPTGQSVNYGVCDESRGTGGQTDKRRLKIQTSLIHTSLILVVNWSCWSSRVIKAAYRMHDNDVWNCSAPICEQHFNRWRSCARYTTGDVWIFRRRL